jgi:hypothetical protein
MNRIIKTSPLNFKQRRQLSEQGKKFRAAFARLRDRPLSGPDLDGIPQTTVDSIGQYLELCRSIEGTTGSLNRVVYRGQTAEYFLGESRQISLLPSLARPFDGRRIPFFKWSMLCGHDDYLNDVLEQHVDFLTENEEEARVFREMLTYRGLPPGREADFLATTPQGRFLVRLIESTDYMFEAATQHYGFETLYLDATYSPLVALYFATNRVEQRVNKILSFCPTWENGVVYVLNVPASEIQSHYSPMAGSPKIADLYDMTFDNDSRPRRQYSLLLTEISRVHAAQVPQLNAYSFYIEHVIRLSEEFWRSEATRTFIEADLGGWLFPSTEVDLLYRRFRSKCPRDFPLYELGRSQSLSEPGGQFEFIRRRRIVLTGSDTEDVMTYLIPTWHSRAGWLEVLPKDDVLRIAGDRDEQELLDIVIACEPFAHEAEELKQIILKAGRRSGRSIAVISTGIMGDVRKRPALMMASIGGVPYPIAIDDPYGTDFLLQTQLFDAMLMISKRKYDQRMKPHPRKFESFLDWATSGERK